MQQLRKQETLGLLSNLQCHPFTFRCDVDEKDFEWAARKKGAVEPANENQYWFQGAPSHQDGQG